MDVKDLRYFVAVYEEGGFARAGLLLETVQSNVSARIRRLEAALGVQLFERHRRGVAATEKGEKLYRHAKRGLEPPDARGNVRLHGVEQDAGAREAAFFIHGDEVPEVLDVHLVGHYSKGPQPSA